MVEPRGRAVKPTSRRAVRGGPPDAPDPIVPSGASGPGRRGARGFRRIPLIAPRPGFDDLDNPAPQKARAPIPSNPAPRRGDPPMSTEAQRQASRSNGSKSCGPVTPRGKRAASRNSTKHGFTGKGDNLPPEMESEFQSELKLYITKHRPRDAYEHDLVRRAALGAVRARRIADAENSLIDERTRTAIKRWDEARADEVAMWADRLAAEPEAALRHLTRITEGCDYLADAWDDLGRVLELSGQWDETHGRRALRLLGLDAEPTPTSPDDHRLFWLSVLSLQFEKKPEPLLKTTFRGFPDASAVRAFLPAPAEARRMLAEFARERIAEYEALGQELWENFDEPSRNSSPTRAIFDPGPEATRLHRYFKDAERMRRRALDELYRLRRDEDRGLRPGPEPARNEPEPEPPATPARNEPEPAPPGDPRDEPGAPTPAPSRPAFDDPRPAPGPVVGPSGAPGAAQTPRDGDA
jgi:hypothetical protein